VSTRESRDPGRLVSPTADLSKTRSRRGSAFDRSIAPPFRYNPDAPRPCPAFLRNRRSGRAASPVGARSLRGGRRAPRRGAGRSSFCHAPSSFCHGARRPPATEPAASPNARTPAPPHRPKEGRRSDSAGRSGRARPLVARKDQAVNHLPICGRARGGRWQRLADAPAAAAAAFPGPGHRRASAACHPSKENREVILGLFPGGTIAWLPGRTRGVPSAEAPGCGLRASHRAPPEWLGVRGSGRAAPPRTQRDHVQ